MKKQSLGKQNIKSLLKTKCLNKHNLNIQLRLSPNSNIFSNSTFSSGITERRPIHLFKMSLVNIGNYPF